MLVLSEDQRISWYELFDCDLVKFDETRIIKEI